MCGRACGGSVPLGPGLIPGIGRGPIGPLIPIGGSGIGGMGLLGPNIGGGGPGRPIIGGPAIGGGIGCLPRENIGFIGGGGGGNPRFIPIGGGGGGILPNLGGRPIAGDDLGAIGPLFNGLIAMLSMN